MVAVLMTAAALAQTAPPAQAPATPQPPAATPAPFAPSIRVGVTIFADYTLTQTPKTTDATNDSVTLSAFSLTRSYINVTGNITPRVSFRVTPDIARETGSGSSLNGSLMFRLKYAYGQLRAGESTMIRLGMQPTPLIDGQEGVYRYRFQGTPFVEREGGLVSADVGLTVLTPLPKGYGDIHAGIYNGDGYTRPEVNDQKAFMARATVRPMPTHAVGKGLRLIGYVHADNYVQDAPRTRAAGSVMFEHARFNFGADFIRRVDQPTPASREVTGRGYSFFVTPFAREKGNGVEGLLRVDAFDPDVDTAGKRQRLLAGVAYWFPRVGSSSATAAVLGHMEQVRESTPVFAMRTTERRFTLNLLVVF
jgi:hypothetical protein